MIALFLALACQDADPRAESLKLRVEPCRSGLRVRGTVDMPDGCVLAVSRRRERQVLVAGRIVVMVREEAEVAYAEVREGRFEITVDLADLVDVAYSKFTQRHVSVLKTLGPGYLNWSREFRVVDPRDVVAGLWRERVTVARLVEQLDAIAVRVREYASGRETNFAPTWKRIDAAEEDLRGAELVHTSAVLPIRDALAAARRFEPDVLDPDDRPVCDVEAMLARFEILVAGARAAASREILLVPLEHARIAWAESCRDGKRTEAWVAARSAVKVACTLAESEGMALPHRETAALLDRLDDALLGGDAERKDARKALDALDGELRKIPSR